MVEEDEKDYSTLGGGPKKIHAPQTAISVNRTNAQKPEGDGCRFIS